MLIACKFPQFSVCLPSNRNNVVPPLAIQKEKKLVKTLLYTILLFGKVPIFTEKFSRSANRALICRWVFFFGSDGSATFSEAADFFTEQKGARVAICEAKIGPYLFLMLLSFNRWRTKSGHKFFPFFRVSESFFYPAIAATILETKLFSKIQFT